MEILLVGLVLGGIIAGWILYQKRQKSPQGSDDQINESAGLAISISADQGHDNYEVLEVNQSQSSDREYELLSHRQSGRISCTCRGFTYTPHERMRPYQVLPGKTTQLTRMATSWNWEESYRDPQHRLPKGPLQARKVETPPPRGRWKTSHGGATWTT